MPCGKGDFLMEEKRIAVVNCIVENRERAAERVNALLSDFGEYIVGRLGIPYHEKNVSVICVVLDAPNTVVNSLTGKLGGLDGVTAKTLFTKF